MAVGSRLEGGSASLAVRLVIYWPCATITHFNITQSGVTEITINKQDQPAWI